MHRDALVVGINTYTRLQPLESSSRDAEAIAQLLTAYGEVQVVKRLPAIVAKEDSSIRVGRKTQVTQNQLEEALVELFKPTGTNLPETALFYFSGHGLRKDRGIQEGFLATSDVNPDSGNWGVSLRWLRELLHNSPIREVIVWLDCCYSGELLNFAEIDPGDRGEKQSLFLIAASREYQVALVEPRKEHGMLTRVLLEGLNPKRHSSGVVTNDSLIEFIAREFKGLPQCPLWHNPSSEILLTGQRTERFTPNLNGVCPYKGLRYFDTKDAPYFHGRDTLTDQLLNQVKLDKGNFLAVLGASGSGKSSVVRAGLIHQLQQGRKLSGTEQWQIRLFTPGERPLEHLAAAFLDQEATNIDRAEQLKKAEWAVSQGAEGLLWLVKAAQAPRTVLVVDQFEEVFTLCQNPAERQQFLACLLGALEQTEDRLCLVLVMRADFLGRCTEQEYSGLANQIRNHLVTVKPMTAEELKRAIQEPAKQAGLRVDDNLVTQILQDLGVEEGVFGTESPQWEPGSLPLLSYTLEQLWQYRTLDRLTLDRYIRLGGVRGALEKRAEEVYQSFSTEEQQAAQQIFLALTQVGEGTEATRRQALKKDLINSQQSEVLVNQVIQRLAAEKLIVTDDILLEESLGRETVVDVAHEALIRYWKRLRQWVNENRDALRKQQDIEEDARDWQGNARRSDYLLRGLKLGEAENFLQEYADQFSLSNLAREFVQASQAERDLQVREKEEQKQQQLRLVKEKLKAARVRNYIAGISSVVLLGLTTLAFTQWIDARTKTLYALTTSSKALSASNQKLEGLVEGVRAGKLLKNSWGISTDAEFRVLVPLAQVFSDVEELNSLAGDREVWCVSFSPDGQTIASGSDDGTIKIWKANGELVNTIQGHDKGVNDVSFSPNGQYIASASEDRTIKIWKADGELINTLQGHTSYVQRVDFSPNSQMIASASQDETVKIWKVDDGTLLKTLEGHRGEVWDVSFSPDDRMIASASQDGTVKLWKVDDGTLLKTLKGHRGGVWDVSFSPDGRTFVSGSSDETIQLWDREGSKLKTLEGHTEDIFHLSFSSDGQMIASASRDGTVKLWSSDGELLKTLVGHQKPVLKSSFSPDNKTIVSASQDKTVKLWDIGSTFLGHRGFVQGISFSQDGTNIASASDDKTVKLWDSEGNLLTSLEGHTDKVNKAIFSSDGQLIATVSNDKTARLWDREGNLLNTLEGHQEPVKSVSFSSDNQLIATASDDKTARFWDREGNLLNTLEGHTNWINGVNFSPDGQLIATASTDETVKLWNRQGTLLKTLPHEDSVKEAIFSPKGNIIASVSADRIYLWNREGKLLRSLKSFSGNTILGISFHPDGKRIGSVDENKTIQLWNVDGTLLQSMKGDEEVISVDFSSDWSAVALISLSSPREITFLSLNLNNLLAKSCSKLRKYLETNFNTIEADRKLCDSETKEQF